MFHIWIIYHFHLLNICFIVLSCNSQSDAAINHIDTKKLVLFCLLRFCFSKLTNQQHQICGEKNQYIDIFLYIYFLLRIICLCVSNKWNRIWPFSLNCTCNCVIISNINSFCFFFMINDWHRLGPNAPSTSIYCRAKPHVCLWIVEVSFLINVMDGDAENM